MKIEEIRDRVIEIRDNHQKHFTYELKTMKSRTQNLSDTNTLIRKLLLNLDKDMCENCTCITKHCDICTIQKEISHLENAINKEV